MHKPPQFSGPPPIPGQSSCPVRPSQYYNNANWPPPIPGQSSCPVRPSQYYTDANGTRQWNAYSGQTPYPEQTFYPYPYRGPPVSWIPPHNPWLGWNSMFVPNYYPYSPPVDPGLERDWKVPHGPPSPKRTPRPSQMQIRTKKIRNLQAQGAVVPERNYQRASTDSTSKDLKGEKQVRKVNSIKTTKNNGTRQISREFTEDEFPPLQPKSQTKYFKAEKTILKDINTETAENKVTGNFCKEYKEGNLQPLESKSQTKDLGVEKLTLKDVSIETTKNEVIEFLERLFNEAEFQTLESISETEKPIPKDVSAETTENEVIGNVDREFKDADFPPLGSKSQTKDLRAEKQILNFKTIKITENEIGNITRESEADFPSPRSKSRSTKVSPTSPLNLDEPNLDYKKSKNEDEFRNFIPMHVLKRNTNMIHIFPSFSPNIYFEMDHKTLYNMLMRYVPTKEQLKNIGYPVTFSENPMITVVFKQSLRKPQPVNKGGPRVLGEVEKLCVRCGETFYARKEKYLSMQSCRYHWGKLKSTGDYEVFLTCCKGSPTSEGCTSSRLHVWNGICDGLNGPLRGFVKPPHGAFTQSIYSLDCEMIYTTSGMEVAKVVLLNVHGRTVYESLIRPQSEVIDYNTRFSGISVNDYIDKTSITLQDAQRDMLQLIHADTIIIGHSLENDLRVLKIVHHRVVDTTVIYPHQHGFPFRRKLKDLSLEILGMKIQNEDSGHDPTEDAKAALYLVLEKVRMDCDDKFNDFRKG